MSNEEAVENVEEVLEGEVVEEEVDELTLARQQLEAAIMTAQHYALVATRAVYLLGGEMFFGADEVEELKELVMVQRLNDNNKLEYRVITVDEAATMLQERRIEAEQTTAIEGLEEDEDDGSVPEEVEEEEAVEEEA